jgi:predicted DNA-binding transcriptional regulator AlpA
MTTSNAVDLLTQPVRAFAAALLDVRAVAAMLDCSPRHVCRLTDAGRMPPPIRLGALVRYRRQTGDPTTGIEDWLAAGCPLVRRASR